MKALVTGASGFIGGSVVRELTRAGIQVREFVRRQSTLTTDEHRGEPVRGDVRDLESVRRAVRGCDAVFHVAALYTFWSRESKHVYDVNVQGTRNVLRAALEAGVKRVVYTSSVATIGAPAPGEVSNEESYPKPQALVGHYKRSKYLAEQEAVALHREGLPVVIVNPSAPVGWGDVRPTPTGRVVLDFIRGRIPAYVDTGLNVVDVEDVAKGHLLAFEKGRLGERYILGNRNTSLRDLLTKLGEVVGRGPPRIKMPFWMALGGAYVDDLLEGRLLRREPRIPLEAVRTHRNPMFVDCTKAINELGLPQTPLETALEKAVRWFNEKRYK